MDVFGILCDCFDKIIICFSCTAECFLKIFIVQDGRPVEFLSVLYIVIDFHEGFEAVGQGLDTVQGGFVGWRF